MILAKLSEWDSSTGLEHVATSWQVAIDQDFNKIITDVSNTSMVILYYSMVEVPKDATYYLRAKRHFNDGSEGNWCDPIEVNNIEESYGNMLLGKDPTITQPYVYVEEDDIMSDKEDIIIKTSTFQSNTDTHDATHWMVYDDNDNLLYTSMFDKENLTSITISNLIIFKQKEKLKFVAIHRGTTGVESKPGKKIIKLADDYGFKTYTNLYNVPVLETLNVSFEVTDTKQGLRINRVELANFDNNETIVELIKSNSNTWVIPYYYLKANAKYKLKVYTNNAYNTQLDVVYLTVTVMDIKNVIVRDEKYEYKKEVINFQNTVSKVNIIPDRVYTESMFNNIILIPDFETKKMKIFKHVKSGNTYLLEYQNKTADGILLPETDDYGDILIKVINNNRLLIDLLNEDGKPTFYVYDYNISNGTFTLLNKLTREDETYTLGKSFAFAQISIDKIIYNVNGTSKLLEYDMVNNSLTNLPEIPLAGITKAVLIRCRNNRIFIGNGASYDAVLFNYERLDYEQGYVFGPNSFLGRNIRVIPLINGGSLVVKYDLEDIEEDGSLSYYDYNKGTFTTLHLPFPGILPTSAIMINTGEILCVYPVNGSVQNYSVFR